MYTDPVDMKLRNTPWQQTTMHKTPTENLRYMALLLKSNYCNLLRKERFWNGLLGV